MFRVIYYYYYLFYSKVLKDDEPHLLTTLALSASEGFFMMYLIDTIWVHFFCKFIPGQWFMISTIGSMILINYLIFHQKGKAKEIIKKKPKFYNSNSLSVVISLAFFLFTSSLLFWVTDYLLYVIKNCS